MTMPARPEGNVVPPPPTLDAEPVGYQTYPPLSEFLAGDGIPGIQYLFVASQDVIKAQKKGFSLVARVEPFLVQGVPTLLMATGKRASQGTDAAALPEVFIDKGLDKLTKLGPAISQEPHPAPTTTSVPAAKAAQARSKT